MRRWVKTYRCASGDGHLDIEYDNAGTERDGQGNQIRLRAEDTSDMQVHRIYRR